MALKFERLEEAQRLMRISKTLSTLPDDYRKKTENPQCDKHRLQFGGDSRFSVFSTTIFLDCHTGYYGDSGCSTLADVDNKIATQLLNTVLNRQLTSILVLMGEEAKRLADKLVDEAKDELDKGYAFLDAIRAEDEQLPTQESV